MKNKLYLVNGNDARCGACGGECDPWFDSGATTVPGIRGDEIAYPFPNSESWISNCCDAGLISEDGGSWEPVIEEYGADE
jgi:hypothetical protein